MTYFQVGPGEEVESAHMNTAISQGVIPFADAAARASAIPTPARGMMTWLDAPGRHEVWDGAGWVAPIAQHDLWWSQLGLAGKRVIIASSVGNVSASGGATISFGYSFASVPVVLAVLGDESASAGYLQLSHPGVTTSQFAVRVLRRDGTPQTTGSFRINYAALGTAGAAQQKPADPA